MILEGSRCRLDNLTRFSDKAKLGQLLDRAYTRLLLNCTSNTIIQRPMTLQGTVKPVYPPPPPTRVLLYHFSFQGGICAVVQCKCVSNSSSFGLSYVLFVLCKFCIFVVSHFCLVMIAPVLGNCLSSILRSTANATFCLNLNNNFLFQSIYL